MDKIILILVEMVDILTDINKKIDELRYKIDRNNRLLQFNSSSSIGDADIIGDLRRNRSMSEIK